MEIMTIKNNLDQMTNAVKDELERVAGPFEVNIEMIVANGKIRVEITVKLYQRFLVGKRIRNEWTSVMVSIYKERDEMTVDNIKNLSSYNMK